MQLDRNGYYDLPPGKIASLVTYLEMTEPPRGAAAGPPRRPGPPPRRTPRSRLVPRPVPPDRHRLALVRPPGHARRRGLRHHRAPPVEVYALTRDGRDEGLLELDRREAAGHRARLFRRHARADRAGRRPLADAPGAASWPGAAGRGASGSTPAPSIIRPRWPSTSAPAFAPTAVPSRSPTIRACSAWRRATPQVGCR